MIAPQGSRVKQFQLRNPKQRRASPGNFHADRRNWLK
jgi:hypothetical protein